MPGIDFHRLRAEITMEHVLDLLRFEPSWRRGHQCYGPCPLHVSDPPVAASNRDQPFSVNVATGRYYCHRCGSHGNQLELWSAFTRLPLHAAAIHLCHHLGREIPWIHRW